MEVDGQLYTPAALPTSQKRPCGIEDDRIDAVEKRGTCFLVRRSNVDASVVLALACLYTN
jgi:hypothetical protein